MPPLSIEPFLRIRAAAGPSFRMDGRRLAYRSNESGIPQLWELDLESGLSRQRTFAEDRVSFVEYSPTASELVFGADAGGTERHQLWYWHDGAAAPEALTADPAVIHNWGGWSPDGSMIAYASNARDQAYFDVYVRAMATGETRMVLQHDGNNYPVCWSPNGDELIVSRPTSTVNNDLYLVSLTSGAVRHLTPHQGDARFGSVQWGPGARSLILTSDRDRDVSALVRLNIETGELTFVRDPAWPVEALRLSPDGRRLAWRSNEDGFTHLHIEEADSGTALDLPSIPRGVVSETCWSADGEHYAFGLSSHNQSSDIWLLDVRSAGLRRLTTSSLAGLDPLQFVAPELIHFTSFDGLEIPAFLYRPEGAREPGPVIVSVHGGPEAQERPGFGALYQYFVQRGFSVLAPNVRGSTGYGRRYTHLDDVELRMDSVADLRAGWEWLVSTGVATPRSIAIMGGSYGGFMVLAALVNQPELWAAGVDIVGIANFVTFLENTGAYRRRLRESEYGSLERDRAFLERISPIHAIDQIRAPLMVIHGANDPRVPVGEAEQIVQALRERESPVEYLRFEDEGHGLTRLENRLIAYPRIAEFLERAIG